jgi:hypothetical protein
MASPSCARCENPPSDPLDECWPCGTTLCASCHDWFGVCAAARCVELQRELAAARTTSEQAAVLAKAGPPGEAYATKLKR